MRYIKAPSTKAFRFSAMILIALISGLLFFPSNSQAADITPFYTFNQSPLLQIFGLPSAENARVVPGGHLSTQMGVAIASNFAVDQKGMEKITLDGETYRTNLALRYGIGKGFEIGLNVPYVVESGGFLDGAVEGFHGTFGLAAGGRDEVRHNRLLFTYTGRNGVERFNITHANGGFGDVRLSGAYQLFGGEPDSSSPIALRASIKVPSGNSGELHGSGSTDFSLWLTAAHDFKFPSSYLTVYGALGGMALTTGDILPDQQRNLVGFGTVGMGWSPYDWLGLKVQFDGHTPFYKNSSLTELSAFSMQTVCGFIIAFTRSTTLDVAFSEDIIVNTSSPDFGMNLTLRTLF
ncbi:MAG TPA: DUF3187 family protein [Geobacteraceae bacterium]|nr:DUF3187 family protein [Geobacteraceae bacterium]